MRHGCGAALSAQLNAGPPFGILDEMNLPKDCKDCHKEKTIHLTEIVGGKLKKVDLCSECPLAQNLTDPSAFNLADQMLGIGAGASLAENSEAEVCPNCGFTVQDFKKTGRLGCSRCYSAFFYGIATVLKDMHKGTHHTGKIPSRMRRQQELRKAIVDLEERMEKAVTSEDYEGAARLRDQIGAVKQELEACVQKAD
jgi:protein arginine kinase activator